MNASLDPSPAPRRLRRRNGASLSGFTLVEVLAALMLIAIVLPVVMRGVSIATSAASISHRRSEATELAASKLNELVATNAWHTGTDTGDFGQEWPDYQWSAQVQDWTESDLRQLDLQVTWGEGAARQSITLTTLIYPNAPTAVSAPSSQTNSPKKKTTNGSSGGGSGAGGLP